MHVITFNYGVRELSEKKLSRMLRSGFRRVIGDPREDWSRSLAKSISYRLYQSFIISPLILWFLTGNPMLCLKFGVAEFLVKIPSYYIFERIWSRVSFGYKSSSR